MLDIEQLIEQFGKDITVRHENGAVFVTPSFYHVDSDESIALRFTQTTDGRPVITDCGTTTDYLRLRDINLENYREKLDAIKERFWIGEENGAFVMELPTDSLPFVTIHLGYFIQAICVIANIDL